MTSSRLPCTRLDRFITRKKEELYRLLANDALKVKQCSTKVSHLRKVIVKAKAELTHMEAKLTDTNNVKKRLAQLEEEYQGCRQRLEQQVVNSSAYRQLSAEMQSLIHRIQVLNTTCIS